MPDTTLVLDCFLEKINLQRNVLFNVVTIVSVVFLEQILNLRVDVTNATEIKEMCQYLPIVTHAYSICKIVL